jgi:hypothetical protein
MKKLLIALALTLTMQGAFAQIMLREDTASQVVSIGPFLDPADGTAEGGLTISNTDVRLKVNGGADAAKNSGGCTHDINGMYDCTFDATDTATVGRLNVSVCETGAVCVRHDFLVVEEAIFDACCVASAAPLTAAAVAALDVAANDDVAGSWGERMSRIPNAAAGANGGIPLSDASGDVTVGTNLDKTGYSLGASGLNLVVVDEPADVPAWGSSSLVAAISYLTAWFRNEVQQTSSTKTLRNDADSAALIECGVSDDSTTFQVSECAAVP